MAPATANTMGLFVAAALEGSLSGAGVVAVPLDIDDAEIVTDAGTVTTGGGAVTVDWTGLATVT